MMSDWPNAIAHIDADCFYASCELTRRPELIGTPVCVLSSQDACIVAKTYDAKAAGIKTGMPVWEAKKLLPRATYIPADFRYYGLLSEKMFSILRRFSPDIEVYSIDEGFIDMNGLRLLWRKGYREIAHDIRQTVHNEVGITVSVGVSVTRTLAKMASEYNKPNGVTVVPGRMIDLFLARVSLGDVCGLGKNRLALLSKFRINTPTDFVNADLHLIQRLLGKTGSDLWHEMRGNSVMGLELTPSLPKSIARTASMGEVTCDRHTILAHLTRHTSRLATEMVLKGFLTQRVTVFIRQKDFRTVAGKIDFEYPTNNYFRISHAVKDMMQGLYQTDQEYRACGVVAERISRASESIPDLFGVMARDDKQASLFGTMAAINRRYGDGTLRVAGAHITRGIKSRPRFMYPMISAL
ncbi:DNA polymerase IV [Mariprofundus erugo]|uniref:DNA polymerase IV n=1 Tax=Mariprofundus erugo TaxID=2528639 RepID=UPI0010FE7E18|nr:DNA polymerase IV [Mariprofundus erugo]TLS78295.1 DNA polymerase IV [Mariprofundus erugo]